MRPILSHSYHSWTNVLRVRIHPSRQEKKCWADLAVQFLWCSTDPCSSQYCSEEAFNAQESHIRSSLTQQHQNLSGLFFWAGISTHVCNDYSLSKFFILYVMNFRDSSSTLNKNFYHVNPSSWFYWDIGNDQKEAQYFMTTSFPLWESTGPNVSLLRKAPNFWDYINIYMNEFLLKYK